MNNADSPYTPDHWLDLLADAVAERLAQRTLGGGGTAVSTPTPIEKPPEQPGTPVKATESPAKGAAGEWWGCEALAQHLGVSVPTLRRWTQLGKVPSHKMGRLVRYSLREVEAAMGKQGNSAMFPSGKERLDL
jgi:excisionase family DNA binding protein